MIYTGEIFILAALVLTAAAYTKDRLYSGPDHEQAHGQQGYGHYHDLAVPSVRDNLLSSPDEPILDSKVEFFEENVDDTIGLKNMKITEGDEQNPEIKRQLVNEVNSERDNTSLKQSQWVMCDYVMNPLFSCYDCFSRLFCKFPVGGRVLSCSNPLKPYCNNGVCSGIPNGACVSAPTPRK